MTEFESNIEYRASTLEDNNRQYCFDSSCQTTKIYFTLSRKQVYFSEYRNQNLIQCVGIKLVFLMSNTTTTKILYATKSDQIK